MTIMAATITAGFLAATTSLASARPVAVKSKSVEYKIGNQTFEGLFVYPEEQQGQGSRGPDGAQLARDFR